jgi:cellulose synthase/poly-beta-1,6-N-acetylglucosamine synthase-like glycosyltransferase
MLDQITIAVLLGSTALVGYAYVGYPLLLWVLGRRGRSAAPPDSSPFWPPISILLAVHNEEHQIRETLEGLLALDYPAELRHILVVSDASTDATDAIVQEFADRGVELLRLPARGGKTAAENAAADRLRGEIVVNTDASVRIPPGALKPLVRAFADPAVGVASGRDVSVSVSRREATAGEGAYVDYEMRVRDLETRTGGIVGASGCFFGMRAELQRHPAPLHLSRDFAAALTAYEHGYRAISVPEAICYVPRSVDLGAEYRRKVRTFARGMRTLLFKRRLANPFRHPLFAWKLLSHKVARWLVPWAALVSLLALTVLAVGHPAARWLLGAAVLVGCAGAVGWLSSGFRRLPRVLSMPAFALAGLVAVLAATVRLLTGADTAVWEPTRRATRAPEIAGV